MHKNRVFLKLFSKGLCVKIPYIHVFYNFSGTWQESMIPLNFMSNTFVSSVVRNICDYLANKYIYTTLFDIGFNFKLCELYLWIKKYIIRCEGTISVQMFSKEDNRLVLEICLLWTAVIATLTI